MGWGFLVSKKLQAEVIVITLRLFRLIVTRCFRFPRLNKNPGLVPDLFNFDLNVCTSTTFDIVPAGTKRRGISYRYFPWFFLLLYFTSAPFWSSFCPSIHPSIPKEVFLASKMEKFFWNSLIFSSMDLNFILG